MPGVDDQYRRAAREMRTGPQPVRVAPSPLLHRNEKATGRQENPPNTRHLNFTVRKP